MDLNFTKETKNGVKELIDAVLDFGVKFAEIIKKNDLTLEDVEALKSMIKPDPKDYFPDLK